MIDRESSSAKIIPFEAKKEKVSSDAVKQQFFGKRLDWDFNDEDLENILKQINGAKDFKDFNNALRGAKDIKFIDEIKQGDPEMEDIEFHLSTIPYKLRRPEQRSRNENNRLKFQMEDFKRKKILIDYDPRTEKERYFMPNAYLPYERTRNLKEQTSPTLFGEWQKKLAAGLKTIEALNSKKAEILRIKEAGKQKQKEEEEQKSKEELKEAQEFLDWKDTDSLVKLLESDHALKAAISIVDYTDIESKRHYDGVLGISSALLSGGDKLLSIEKVSKFGNLSSLIGEIGEDMVKNILCTKIKDGYRFTKDGKEADSRLINLLKFTYLKESLPKKRERKEVIDPEKIKQEINELISEEFLSAYEDFELGEETKNITLQKKSQEDMDRWQKIIREKLGILGLLTPQEVENKEENIEFVVYDEGPKPTGRGIVKKVEIVREKEAPEGKEEVEKVIYQTEIE